MIIEKIHNGIHLLWDDLHNWSGLHIDCCFDAFCEWELIVQVRRTKHCRRFYASQFCAQISSASCLELKSVQSSMMLAGFPSDIQQIFKLAEVTKSIRISVQSTSSPWQLFTHSPALKALRSSRCWKIVLGLIANYIIEIRAQKKTHQQQLNENHIQVPLSRRLTTLRCISSEFKFTVNAVLLYERLNVCGRGRRRIEPSWRRKCHWSFILINLNW